MTTDGKRASQDSASPPRSIREFAAAFNARFEAFLEPSGDVPPRLADAVRYSALAPGKRLRPYVLTQSCQLVGGTVEQAASAAAAVECIHAFSLIHDDLPAMDDDELRRGRPTCHRRFDEATAILAGDTLVVLAFELLSRQGDRDVAGRLVLELADGAGWCGMIGGQAADIAGQSEAPNRALAEYIHQRKTARLFETACRMGALAGHGDEAAIAALGRYGQMLGRAFQIVDDLLDVTSSATTLGKETRKDAKASKQTFPRCVGLEDSRAAARDAAAAAVAALSPFGPEGDDLRALAHYVIDRDY